VVAFQEERKHPWRNGSISGDMVMFSKVVAFQIFLTQTVIQRLLADRGVGQVRWLTTGKTRSSQHIPSDLENAFARRGCIYLAPFLMPPAQLLSQDGARVGENQRRGAV
jgi:hypothetical protein